MELEQQAALDRQLPTQEQFEAWMSSLPAHVAEAVRAHSPFVPHRLKGTGHTVFIARFQETSGDEKGVRLSVIAPQSANPSQADDLAFEVDPEDLYTLAS